MDLELIALRLYLLPFQIVVSAVRLLFRSLYWIVHNNSVKTTTYHLSRLPFQITALVPRPLHHLLRSVVGSGIAVFIYLFKAFSFARAIQDAVCLAALVFALVFAYLVISYHLDKREDARKERMAEERKKEAKEHQERVKRMIEEYLRREQKAREEILQRAREHTHRRTKPKQQNSHNSSQPHPPPSSAFKARQYNQQQRDLSHDFHTWRDECKALLNDPASVTTLPQPPGDLATLYKKARLSTAELKKERRIWHPDAWSQVPEPYKGEIHRMVTGVFQIVDAIYVGRQQS